MLSVASKFATRRVLTARTLQMASSSSSSFSATKWMMSNHLHELKLSASSFLARRGFHSSAQPQMMAQPANSMFCFQCEQTEKQTGCTTIGVCGKTPEVAQLQDLLVHSLKQVSRYATLARGIDKRASDPQLDRFVLSSLFATMTNVNFDSHRMVELIDQSMKMRDRAFQLYQKAATQGQREMRQFDDLLELPSMKRSALEQEGRKHGILARKEQLGDDYVGLQEMALYGLKGLSAYAEHAACLGNTSDEVYASVHQVLSNGIKSTSSVDELLADCMKVGKVNLDVLAMLDSGHTTKFGHPEPTVVDCFPVEGKSILVSGHDLVDLESILQQTEGKNINIYTHGELLPAHSYPGLKKYAHLKGHYGGPWQLQKFEFAAFPGPIVVTTNCLIEPMQSYADRLYTRSVVGWPDIQHLETNDFSAVVAQAQQMEGFSEADVDSYEDKTLTIGFGHNAVLSVADTVVDLVKKGEISHFHLIGGCDGSESERSYFTDLAKATDPSSIILTLGCGKYRLNQLELGDIQGIPRVLDMGQCNDSYSAVQVAVALSKAFDTDVNGLPLSFAVSWFEQKAVAVLLSLLHLNIKGIKLGPHLPGFATPNMVNVLVEKFEIAPIGDVQEDLAQMTATN